METLAEQFLKIEVRVRHSSTCKDRAKGKYWHQCNCRKVLYIYEGGGPGTGKIRSAHTRSWTKAEERRDSILNPTKAQTTMTIEKAVAWYLKDIVFRLGEGGTLERNKTLLGDVKEDGTVIRKG